MVFLRETTIYTQVIWKPKINFTTEMQHFTIHQTRFLLDEKISAYNVSICQCTSTGVCRADIKIEGLHRSDKTKASLYSEAKTTERLVRRDDPTSERCKRNNVGKVSQTLLPQNLKHSKTRHRWSTMHECNDTSPIRSSFCKLKREVRYITLA